jgi:hypothetical protein
MIDEKAALLDALIASVRELSRKVFNGTENEVSKSPETSRRAERRIISGSADIETRRFGYAVPCEGTDMPLAINRDRV